MITVSVSDVNGSEILAAIKDPFNQFLRMFNRQKRVDEDGIAFPINERDRIRNPGQIFLAERKTLSSAATLLGQKLPIQLRHRPSFLKSLLIAEVLHRFAHGPCTRRTSPA